jgi:hypothetical protein
LRIIVAVVALLACVVLALFGIRIPRMAEEDNIRESVFLYQFAHNGSALGNKSAAYYLAIGTWQHDPSPQFIIRFQGLKPAVKPVSGCTTESSVDGAVDPRTHQRGLIFTITQVRWLSNTRVEVSGGYWESGMSSSENIYTVDYRRGRWTVTSDKLVGIS